MGDDEDGKDFIFDLNITAHHVKVIDLTDRRPTRNELMVSFLKRSIWELQISVQIDSMQQQQQLLLQADTTQNKKRSLCREIQLPKSIQSDIKRLLFDNQGKLRRDLRRSLDFGNKHGLLVLSLGNQKWPDRRDFRWILPLLLDGQELAPQSLFNRIQTTLSCQGLIDLNHEYVHDMSILIGGTTYQFMHHDFEASAASNKQHVADACTGPFSPASILIGLGPENNPVRLAVSLEQVALIKS